MKTPSVFKIPTILHHMCLAVFLLTCTSFSFAGAGVGVGVSESKANASSAELGHLINGRLAHMKNVAAYKWINKIEIEDRTREQRVIQAAQTTGLQKRITLESSRRFFSLQIEAAKEIQRYWFKQWAKGKAPEKAPDLVRDIRPRLIELGDDIVQALGNQHQWRSLNGASPKIGITGLSSKTATDLAAAAQSISFYPNQLDQILQSKQLRVGTTLDYAPFSYEQHGQPTGIDVELAADLANALNAELILVKTSWPTLMSDLKAGKFDIAMSGVSINLERQKVAFFSVPHHRGGKTAISRCDRVSRFSDLEKIDQPSTRMIVNPGGTNQRFVQANIKRANITVHEDNRTIFDEIIQDRADIMITDEIEVRLQSALHPALCPATPDKTFTFQLKAFLLPQDHTWKLFVDTWLTQRIGEGVVNTAFTQHLAN